MMMWTNLRVRSLCFSAAVALVLAACGDVGDAPKAELTQAQASTAAAGIALPIDTARSAVNWRAAKVTRAHDGGFRAFDGVILMSDRAVTGAEIQIDATSIWSDNQRLTGHLKSPDFFEVETYPTASFQAVEIIPVDSAGATHLVTGNLTLHATSNGVRFPANIHVDGDEVHVAADFIIDRTEWGITYAGQADDLIEDNVRIMFDVYAAAGDEEAATVELTGDQRSENDRSMVN